MNSHAIVADIGGTNARFAVVDMATLSISEIVIYQSSEAACLEQLFDTYRRDKELDDIDIAAVAIAGPVYGNIVQLTNLPWTVSKKSIQSTFGLKYFSLINDFSAIALSLSHQQTHDLEVIGPAMLPDPNGNKLVLGPGTGLGVAYLAKDHKHLIPVPSEGGHMSFAPDTDFEWYLYQTLKAKFGRVSIERVLSGPGLESIYTALNAYYNCDNKPLNAKSITHQALMGECDIAIQSTLSFLNILARTAGDFALNANATGGIYLSGGIVLKMIDLIDEKSFRSAFEAKGRFQNFVASIPTYILHDNYPGLKGAAISLQQMITDATELSNPINFREKHTENYL